MSESDKKKTAADGAKELLADPRHRIILDDFVNERLRAVLDALSPKHFPVSGAGTNEEFV